MNLEKIQGKDKITITIDKKLLEKINKIREDKKINCLSPLINEILWESIKNGSLYNLI